MSNIRTVDARGLSCPQPAMLTRQALQESNKGTVEVLVDCGTAQENVSRLAKKAGWAMAVEEQPEGSCRIVLTK
ncbi:MAG: sulfurtransferase TusA family protein [Planctomycetota bacterium]